MLLLIMSAHQMGVREGGTEGGREVTPGEHTEPTPTRVREPPLVQGDGVECGTPFGGSGEQR